MTSGPNWIVQSRSSCWTKPTGSPVRASLRWILSPFHLISPLLRTFRTVTPTSYSGSDTRLG